MKKTLSHGSIFLVLSIELVFSLLVDGYYIFQCLFLLVFLVFLIFYYSEKKVIFIEVIAFFAIVQWLIVPMLSYFFFDTKFLWMAVDANQYFSIVIPSTILMLMGFFLPLKQVSLSENHQVSATNRGVILICIGLASFLLKPFVPIALVNLLTLASYLIHVGFFYIFFSNHKLKWLLSIIILVFMIGIATKEGMFKDFFFWIFFFLIFYFLIIKVSFYKKILIGTTGLILILSIQALKQEYRQATWGETQKTRNLTLFNNLIIEKTSDPIGLFTGESFVGFLNRANQGTIISMTFAHVPEHEPFANGETVINALVASAIPRIFWPDKPVVGGKEMFPRFTGKELPGKTSANISPMGEAYVNFGKTGGMVFMFIFGFFVNLCFMICMRLAQKKILFLFWSPIIFHTLILLGTDLLAIFNSIVMASIFIWIIHKVLYLFFRIKIF